MFPHQIPSILSGGPFRMSQHGGKIIFVRQYKWAEFSFPNWRAVKRQYNRKRTSHERFQNIISCSSCTWFERLWTAAKDTAADRLGIGVRRVYLTRWFSRP